MTIEPFSIEQSEQPDLNVAKHKALPPELIASGDDTIPGKASNQKYPHEIVFENAYAPTAQEKERKFDSSEYVNDLIEQLGSRDPQVREGAYRRLVGLGSTAFPYLAKGLDHANPQISVRCEDAIQEVLKNNPEKVDQLLQNLQKLYTATFADMEQSRPLDREKDLRDRTNQLQAYKRYNIPLGRLAKDLPDRRVLQALFKAIPEIEKARGNTEEETAIKVEKLRSILKYFSDCRITGLQNDAEVGFADRFVPEPKDWAIRSITETLQINARNGGNLNTPGIRLDLIQAALERANASKDDKLLQPLLKAIRQNGGSPEDIPRLAAEQFWREAGKAMAWPKR